MADEPESNEGERPDDDSAGGADASPAEEAPSADLAGFAEEVAQEESASADASPAPEPAPSQGPAVVGIPSGPGIPTPEPEPDASSPYGHLLRIRGEVDQTKAIGLFLGGLTAILAVWFFLTAGDARAVRWTTTVAEDGTVELTETPDGEVWAEGYELAGADDELTDRNFKVEGKTLSFEASQAGIEVNVGYIMGSEPIVSHFILPTPGKVLRAVVNDVTGPSFEVTCPGQACPTREKKEKLNLSGGDGEALQAYRAGLQEEAPGISCPHCNTSLDGEVAIALPGYRFRWGLLSTIRRTVFGFLIAVAICLPLGVLAGAFPPIKRFVSPLEIAGGYTPPVALLPLAVALYGVAKNSGMDSVSAAELARTTFLVVVIAFWLYPLVTSEVESVDEVFINTAYTLGASRWQTIMKVLVPVSMASIWQHLRATYAIGWASIILAEGFAVGRETGETGIGFFMVDMQRRNIMEQYFAAVLAIIITGILLDYLFKRAGKLMFPYEEAK